MSKSVIVLGGTGRFGRAAIEAFYDAGWQVNTLVRSAHKVTHPNIKVIEGDAFDKQTVANACMGKDVIVHALNPQYENWLKEVPILTENVIHAAKQNGATIVIPGNVYNYGAEMPPVLTEATPHLPTSRKGKLRVDMEAAFESATQNGVQTIILRAGDFIERQETGNWFDSFMANKVGAGKFTYPGALDIKHAWAYLPDMARAMAALAERRDELASFEEFGFEGFGVTGAEMIAAIETVTNKPLKVSGIPWPIFRVLSLFSPKLREVFEMRYLWQVPHVIDGSKLKRLLPQFEPTSITAAMEQVV